MFLTLRGYRLRRERTEISICFGFVENDGNHIFVCLVVKDAIVINVPVVGPLVVGDCGRQRSSRVDGAAVHGNHDQVVWQHKERVGPGGERRKKGGEDGGRTATAQFNTE